MELSSFRHVERGTFVHKLDPRVKVMSVAVLSLLLIFSQLWEFLFLAPLILTVGVAGKVPLLNSFREVKPILFFFLLAFLIHSFFSGGEPIVSYNIFTLTENGIVHGGKIVLRLFLIVSLGFIYSSTTSPSDNSSAFEWFLRPAPVDEKKLGTAANMGIRFFPLVSEEVQKIKDARRARCSDLREGNLRRLKNMVVPLIVRSITRAEKLADALESRLYSSERTSVFKFRIGKIDYATIIAVGAISSLLIVL